MSSKPIRGTQSFVGVMAEVWKRPSLTGIEIAWRWVFGGVFLWLVGCALGAAGMDVHFDPAAMERVADSGNWTSLAVFHHAFIVGVADRAAMLRAIAVVVAALVVWAVWSALGRTVLLLRLDRMKPRVLATAVLATMRVLSWSALIAVWFVVLAKTWMAMVVAPEARGAYPSYVPGFAIVLFTTLALFMLWCLVSWVFRLAAVLVAARGMGVVESLRAAWRSGPLRGKLIEINLVMGIVKVALLVLAMVFSACPLPFEAVATPDFLRNWWIGVGVFYLVTSDYFHVVRAVAYLRLWQAYDFLPDAAAQAEERAS